MYILPNSLKCKDPGGFSLVAEGVCAMYLVPATWAFGRPPDRLIGGFGGADTPRNQVELRLLAGLGQYALFVSPGWARIAHIF